MEKTPRLGKIEGKKRRGWQRIDSVIDTMSMSLGEVQQTVRGRRAWSIVVQEVTNSQM